MIASSNRGIVLIEVMIAVAVMTVVYIVVAAYINSDDDPPALTGAAATGTTQACLNSTLMLNFIVEDPDIWYQDDSGVATVTINSATWTFKKDIFKTTLPFIYNKSDCAATDTFNVSATDHTGNAAATSVGISGIPQHYCCNAATAAANGCSC